MFFSIRHKLQCLFSSGWSRWIDKDYVMSYEYGCCQHVLILIQMKVNSNNGKKKFRNVTIIKSTYKVEIEDCRKEILKKIK